MPPDEVTGVATTGSPDHGLRHGDPSLVSARVRQIDTAVAYVVTGHLEQLLKRRVAQAGEVNPTFGADIAERVRRFTLGGGRRARPQFLWWALRACGMPDDQQMEAALQLGAALELLQTCALVHDDVMDQAQSRRGRPSVHVDCAAQYARPLPSDGRRFGESSAILVGDLALAWADDEAACLDLPTWHAGRIRDIWSRMRLEMVAGQYLDIQGEATQSRSLSQAVSAACLKSALYTVERPLQLGATLGGADEATLRALCSAGRDAGLAFQLRDDLDDAFGDPSRRRDKPAGGDLRAGKPTYLVALAHAQATVDGDHHALKVLGHALGRSDATDEDLDEVRDVLERTGARRDVEDKICRLIAQSKRNLDAAPLDPVARARLHALVHHVAASPAAAGEPAGGLSAGAAQGAAC
ncbi:polyprenyl synthetase family protein [Streptomyces sp. NPDC002795]|uniref:polyprenyl synthetase family protein n=1 Tax=Streptomyces sp. NPDC002795 TaxID=3364665 RepID=UPI0036C177D5